MRIIEAVSKSISNLNKKQVYKENQETYETYLGQLVYKIVRIRAIVSSVIKPK